jgi:hypothetical protein
MSKKSVIVMLHHRHKPWDMFWLVNHKHVQETEISRQVANTRASYSEVPGSSLSSQTG